MRALWISLAVLGVTALVQGLVVVLSGSVALLGDTVHNVADALTAVPLGIAFVLGRRAADRRFTYGYGRAEDLAGIVIVLVIAGLARSSRRGWPSTGCSTRGHDRTCRGRRRRPRSSASSATSASPATGSRWAGEIGSAALVADGLHARTDGFTSLAVLLGAGRGGARLATGPTRSSGWRSRPRSLFVLRDAAREVFRRLMDAVDPGLVDRAERPCAAFPASAASAGCGCAGSGTGCAPRRRWSVDAG